MVLHNFFRYFATTGFSKNAKVHPLQFSHCEIFQNDSFWLYSSVFPLSQHHAMSEIHFFFKTVVFSALCDFFPTCGIKASTVFTRNETFCEHRGLLRVFGNMRHFRKKKKNIFFQKKFPVEEKVVSESYRA